MVPLFSLKEYKPVPKKKLSSKQSGKKRKSSNAVSDSSSSSDEDQVRLKVPQPTLFIGQTLYTCTVFMMAFPHYQSRILLTKYLRLLLLDKKEPVQINGG